MSDVVMKLRVEHYKRAKELADTILKKTREGVQAARHRVGARGQP